MTKSAPAIIAACALLALPAAQQLRQSAEVVPALRERSAPEHPDTTSTSGAATQVANENPPQKEQKIYDFPLIVLDHVGSWAPWNDQFPNARRFAAHLVDFGGYKTTPAQVQQVLDMLDRLSGFFRGIKVLNPPKGMQVTVGRYIGADGFLRDSGSDAMTSQLSMRFYGYFSVCDTCKTGLDTSEPIDWIHVWVNNIAVISGRTTPYREDERGPMYSVPRIIGSVAGFPEYDSGFIVLTRIKRPLWIPVTQERYIRHHIRESQVQLARSRVRLSQGTPYERWLKEEEKRLREQEERYQRLKKSNPKEAEDYRRVTAGADAIQKKVGDSLKAGDAAFREDTRKGLEFQEQSIGKLEAELASLSSAERAAPAHVFGGTAGGRPSGLVDPETRGSQMLVEPNRDFFDQTLPHTAVQLIAIRGLTRVEPALERMERRTAFNPSPRDSGYFMSRTKVEIRRTLPWQAIAGLLEGK